MTERRRHPRLSYGTEVWIGQDGIFSRTNERITNISVAGVFIETAQSFAVGTVLSVRFKFGAGTVSCAAIVRNSRPGEGLGVELLDLTPDAKRHLEEFLAQQVAAANRNP